MRWWIESKSSIEEIQVLRPPDNCKDNNVLNKMDKAISSRWFSCLDFWTQFSFRVKMGCSRFMVRPLPCRTGTVNRKKNRNGSELGGGVRRKKKEEIFPFSSRLGKKNELSSVSKWVSRSSAATRGQSSLLLLGLLPSLLLLL